MTPFFAPRATRPRRLRRAEDLPRRRRRADDRGRRRGLRRLHLSRLHHREVPPRGHAAGARPRTRQGRQDDGGLRDRRPVVRRHRQRRGRDRKAADGTRQQIAFYGSTPAYRGVLETARLGRPPGRAERAVEAGQVGGDGQPDRRRHAQHVRGRRRTGSDRSRARQALRRRHRPHRRSMPRTPATPIDGAR